MAPPAAAVNEWLMQVEELSGGKVAFTAYWAGSLFGSKEALQSYQAGIADCGALWLGDFPAVFELGDWTGLPFLGFPSAHVATEILRELFDTFPELLVEYEGLKVLYPTCWSEEFGWMHTTGKVVTKAEDLVGLKVVGLASLLVRWHEAMGAVPVPVAVEDTYTSLERGLVEGEMTGFARIVGGHMTVEVMTVHTKLGPPYSMGYNPIIFNTDSWNALPDDIKKIIEELEPWYTENRIAKEVEGGRNGEQFARDLGHEFYELEPGEYAKFEAAAKPIHQDWIDELEAAGKPAQDVYDEIMRLIEEYS